MDTNRLNVIYDSLVRNDGTVQGSAQCDLSVFICTLPFYIVLLQVWSCSIRKFSTQVNRLSRRVKQKTCFFLSKIIQDSRPYDSLRVSFRTTIRILQFLSQAVLYKLVFYKIGNQLKCVKIHLHFLRNRCKWINDWLFVFM